MLKRTITALVALIVVAIALYFRGWFANLLVAVLMLIGLWEEFEAFQKVHKPVRWPALLAAFLILPGYYWIGSIVILPLLVTSTLLVMLMVCCRKEPDWVDAGVSVYPIITIFLPMSLLFVLFNDMYQPSGSQLVLLVLVIAMASDTFAYFIGVLFGKHKLCPNVSPKKTVEGAIAGLVGGVLSAVVYTTILVHLGYKGMPHLPAVLGISLLGGIAAQVGDLTASLVKRHCGIKDFGSIFPGHGGVMDRIDSIIFTLMVVCSYALLWGQPLL